MRKQAQAEDSKVGLRAGFAGKRSAPVTTEIIAAPGVLFLPRGLSQQLPWPKIPGGYCGLANRVCVSGRWNRGPVKVSPDKI